MIRETTLNARYQRLRAKQKENEALTYTVNWAAELAGDTIATSTFTSEDSGITIANSANTTTQTSARLSGDPGRYRVVNKITLTTSGDTMECFIDLTILYRS